MPANLLILHPAAAEAAPPADRVLESVKALGLIGEPFEFEGRVHYRPGEAYLQLVTFLGCSPVVSLGEPGVTGDEFAHITVAGPWDLPRFRIGANAKPPRCPACRERFTPWQPPRTTEAAATEWTCPGCGTPTRAAAADWRRSAGYARLFLELWGVFESEAVPSDRLMTGLEQTTGRRWTYFYLRQG